MGCNNGECFDHLGSVPLVPRETRIMAAIPAFNEEPSIGTIVREAARYADSVVVVDDGSHDRTSDVAAKAGAYVIRRSENGGYAEAIRTCFRCGLNQDADVLVTLDGDGQHSANDIPTLVAPIISGEADIVIGSRVLGRFLGIPRYRRVGIGIITWLYNVGAPLKVSDAQSGYRAYSKRALSFLSDIHARGMDISVATLIAARKLGLRIVEVPIACTYHGNGSTLNPVVHGVSVALATAFGRWRVELFGQDLTQQRVRISEARERETA